LDGVDERTLTSLPEPFVLVFGNEGQGVSAKNMDLGSKVRIEMNGIDSLNVAVAAGIFMYRFKKN
ncbi:MAG: RNA methyltransferase, partial [Bacilli bacterium]|nr:RNA methyltransferase [Bacilli bacterium]